MDSQEAPNMNFLNAIKIFAFQKKKRFFFILRFLKYCVLKSLLDKTLYFHRFRLLLMILLLCLAVYSLPVKLPISYPLNLNEQVASQLLASVVSALASILAIVFAVIFVTFELIYKTFHGYVKKALWQNDKFKELSILYVLSVIIVIFSLAILNNSIRSYNLILLDLYLFSICLVVLIPYIRALVSDVVSMKDVNALVAQLKTRPYQHMARRRMPAEALTSYLDERENDPLFILAEAACSYVREDNYVRTYRILVGVTNEAIIRAKTLSDFRSFIREYLSFYRKILSQGIKFDNEAIAGAVFDMIHDIHYFCAQNKKPWHEMIELNELMTEAVSLSIRKGFTETARSALWTIPMIFEYHLKNNSPKQDDVWDLNIVNGKPPATPNHDVSLQWRHVSDDYTRLQADLTRVAIQSGSETLTSAGIHGLESMAESTINATSLGERQVADILSHISFTAQQLMLECSKKDFWLSMVKISPFQSFVMNNCLDKNKPYSNILLVDAVELQVKLLKQKRLPVFELNDLGTTGRHSVHEIKKANDIYEQAIRFIVLGFSEMQKILEASLDESTYELYAKVYKQLDSLRRWKGKKSPALRRAISVALKRFRRIAFVKTKLKKSVIRWPKSVGRLSEAHTID